MTFTITRPGADRYEVAETFEAVSHVAALTYFRSIHPLPDPERNPIMLRDEAQYRITEESVVQAAVFANIARIRAQ